MNLKLSSDKSLNIDADSLFRAAGKFWKKSRMVLFFMLLVLFIAGGSFIWRQSLTGAGWSQQRRQEFMDSQNKNVEFKQQAYQKVVDQIEARKKENSDEYQSVKDIFSSYK